jgi:hypothetical protein
VRIVVTSATGFAGGATLTPAVRRRPGQLGDLLRCHGPNGSNGGLGSFAGETIETHAELRVLCPRQDSNLRLTV